MNKLIQILTLSSAVTVAAYAHADERTDINQILKEIHYTKEVVQQLKKRHRGCSAKICFHYDGLLQQLATVETGIKEYLNLNIKALHTTPQQPLTSPVYKVRKN